MEEAQKKKFKKLKTSSIKDLDTFWEITNIYGFPQKAGFVSIF